MSFNTAQERTEQATDRKRREAREKGQVVHSADISSAFILLIGSITLWHTSQDISSWMKDLVRREFLNCHKENWDLTKAAQLFATIMWNFGSVMVPLLVIVFFVGLMIGAIQVGGVQVSFKTVSPEWSRLSLTKGWEKLFSMRSVMRATMQIAKLVTICLVVVFVLRMNNTFATTVAQSLEQSVSRTWYFSLSIAMYISLALLVVGAFDYLFNRFKHEQDLRMTKQEVRDDHKEDDGDPNTKARIRKKQKEAAELRSTQQTADATVVLTNPTHYAVAIKYDRDAKMDAPILVAKGKGAFAQQIAAIAKKNNIPVLERKPLTRAIYASVEINQPIPSSLYQAMAEILAYVYGLKRSRAA